MYKYDVRLEFRLGIMKKLLKTTLEILSSFLVNRFCHVAIGNILAFQMNREFADRERVEAAYRRGERRRGR